MAALLFITQVAPVAAEDFDPPAIVAAPEAVELAPPTAAEASPGSEVDDQGSAASLSQGEAVGDVLPDAGEGVAEVPEGDDEMSSMSSPAEENDGSGASTSSTIKTLLPQADEASGALLYNYPIRVPPGRNGLEPDLKLTYSNQSNGVRTWLGHGWDVSIPSIERVNKTGVNNLYTKNTFTSSQSGELVMSSSGTYVAKVETGDFFSYSLNGTYWTLTDKQGTTYVYGSASSSRMDDPADESKVLKWMLTEVRDTNDNYVRYEYTKDGGQIYPSRILYTGHGSTDGIFEVSFTLEERPDRLTQYFAGFAVTTRSRISEIRMKVNGATVNTYALDYASGDGGVRSMLSLVSASGTDEVSSASVALPPQQLAYQSATDSWETDANYAWPTFGSCAGGGGPLKFVDTDGTQLGVRIADVNGDSHPDILKSFIAGGDCADKGTWINKGNGTGWTRDDRWNSPVYFGLYDGGQDRWGPQFGDVNGDGLDDLLYAGTPFGTEVYGVYLSTGNGWTPGSSYVWPNNPLGGGGKLMFAAQQGYSLGARVMDINGDGLADIIKYHQYESAEKGAWINKGDGTGWTLNHDWDPPAALMENSGEDKRRIQFGDWNGDGLPDMLYGIHNSSSPGQYIARVYHNNGRGWTLDTSITFPEDVLHNNDNPGTPLLTSEADTSSTGVWAMDVNGDGFTDLVKSMTRPNGTLIKAVYLNKGDGTGWTRTLTWGAPMTFASQGQELNVTGAQLTDMTGDGLTDIVYSGYAEGSGTSVHGVYTKRGNPADVMKEITYPHGGKTTVTYKPSSQYREGSNVYNPALPISVQVVQKTENVDGFGNTSTMWHAYQNGHYYYGSPTDRRFAGFASIFTYDAASNTRIAHFHQGNSSATSSGEYLDHPSKIGRPYRTEVISSGSTTQVITVNRWERTDNATSTASFVRVTQRVDLDYDGDSDHKDRAESFAYNTADGNMSERTFWGEVSGSTDGTFTDSGTDKRQLSISYATNTNEHILSLPKSETMYDYGGSRIKEARYYYDTQALGTVNVGNVTKKEDWKSGSSYVDAEKTYNAYGLVTQDKDPRDKTTTYAYDTHSLYPATITNPLSHVFQRSYDYSSGMVRSATDANLLATSKLFDGLDRVLEERQPDQSTSSTAVVKTGYVYTDTALAPNVKRTDWLDGGNGVDTWTYLDGFDRPVQIRREAESGYATTNFDYNTDALLEKESLPYFSSGSSKTTAATNTDLYSTYGYDALKRVTSVVTGVGTTSTAYDDWKTTATDPRGKAKHLYRDGFGRLNRVDEVNGPSTYTTLYEYDGNDNLTKLTDALSNVRNFTYDGLNRRLTSQDLHASADATFGTWTYGYDDAGNATSVLDPKSQTVNYTFDDLNRPLTEDFTGTAGTETLFTYDTCTYGKGKLCTAVASSATTTYLYGPTGLVTREAKAISSASYQTDTTYDRHGNALVTSLPDSSEQRNSYNGGGLLERVELRESGGSWGDIVKSFDWSPLRQAATIVYGNSATTTNSYDATKLYRLTSKLTTAPGATNLQSYTYTYDGNGNLTRLVDASQTNAAKTVDYSYDDLNRLTGATSTNAVSGGNYTQSYVYNAIGNLTNRSDMGAYLFDGDQGSSYANPHAATTVGGVSYGYDVNGNLTSSGTSTFAWDFKNRLFTAQVNGATSTYAYDHAGNRVLQTTSATSTRYASKSYAVTSGVPTKHIFAGNLLVGTVEGTTSTAVIRYVHTDHLTGSSLVSSATGTLVELLDYYPYGGVRLDEKAGAYSEARKYAGHEFDDQTGLSYMGTRYYDASLGRFISQDPAFVVVGNVKNGEDRRKLEAFLSDPQQLNAYGYARNNPLAYLDPDGNIAVPASLRNAYLKAGDWGNRVYANNSAAAFVMDHPYLPAAIGAAPLAIYGAAAVAPAIGAESLIKAGAGAGLGSGNTFLTAKAEGRTASASEHLFSAGAGAVAALIPGGWRAQAALGATVNAVGQAAFQPGRFDLGAVGIAAFGSGVASGLLNMPGIQAPALHKSFAEQLVGWTIEVPAQAVRGELQQSQEIKKRQR